MIHVASNYWGGVERRQNSSMYSKLHKYLSVFRLYCLRFLYNFFLVSLRDGAKRQYTAQHFDSVSVCSANINLQTCKTLANRSIAFFCYRPGIMCTFMPGKEDLWHALVFLFYREEKAVKSHCLYPCTFGEHALSDKRSKHVFDNLEIMIL